MEKTPDKIQEENFKLSMDVIALLKGKPYCEGLFILEQAIRSLKTKAVIN